MRVYSQSPLFEPFTLLTLHKSSIAGGLIALMIGVGGVRVDVEWMMFEMFVGNSCYGSS